MRDETTMSLNKFDLNMSIIDNQEDYYSLSNVNDSTMFRTCSGAVVKKLNIARIFFWKKQLAHDCR